MKARILSISLVVAVASLTGCSYGAKQLQNESTMSLEGKLVRGKTTKDQVRTMLGEPTETGQDRGKEVWVYSQADTTGKGYIPFVPLFTGEYGATSRQLSVFFTRNGLVDDWTFRQSKH